MKKKDEVGVLLDSGAQDWQVFQQDSTGTADVKLRGRWITREKFKAASVLVRIVFEDKGESVGSDFDWRKATTRKDGTWYVTLKGLPSGGLYRIETVLQLDGAPPEWSQRGDIVHHVGVGDVWVIAGQSNAAGYGKAPALDPPELGVHMFHACGEWKLATHPLGDSSGTCYPPNREGANASHSPWLAFARGLKSRLGYPIGLIPAALGGSPISSWDRHEDGTLFENMLRYIKDSGGGVKGMVWYQGESDAGEPQLSLYPDRFRRFVADLRRTLKDSAFPVITAQLNRVVCGEISDEGNAGWEGMREAQRQLARRLKNVFIVATVDLGLSDGIHIDSPGNLVIGERMAAAALGGVHGLDVKYLHPDCVRASLVSPTCIELEFVNVDDHLHYESFVKSEFPFAVRDREGDVPLVGLQMAAANRCRLLLEREPGRSATVIGAPTSSPPRLIPYDQRGYRPMLGFTMKVNRGSRASD